MVWASRHAGGVGTGDVLGGGHFGGYAFRLKEAVTMGGVYLELD